VLNHSCRRGWRTRGCPSTCIATNLVSKVSKPTCLSAFCSVSSPRSARCQASTKRRPMPSNDSPMCTRSSSRSTPSWPGCSMTNRTSPRRWKQLGHRHPAARPEPRSGGYAVSGLSSASADRTAPLQPIGNSFTSSAGETQFSLAPPAPHPSLPRMRGRVREGERVGVRGYCERDACPSPGIRAVRGYRPRIASGAGSLPTRRGEVRTGSSSARCSTLFLKRRTGFAGSSTAHS
jgi:hypothetical protein